MKMKFWQRKPEQSWSLDKDETSKDYSFTPFFKREEEGDGDEAQLGAWRQYIIE